QAALTALELGALGSRSAILRGRLRRSRSRRRRGAWHLTSRKLRLPQRAEHETQRRRQSEGRHWPPVHRSVDRILEIAGHFPRARVTDLLRRHVGILFDAIGYLLELLRCLFLQILGLAALFRTLRHCSSPIAKHFLETKRENDCFGSAW